LHLNAVYLKDFSTSRNLALIRQTLKYGLAVIEIERTPDGFVSLFSFACNANGKMPSKKALFQKSIRVLDPSQMSNAT
jgi:hypothetical protein